MYSSIEKPTSSWILQADETNESILTRIICGENLSHNFLTFPLLLLLSVIIQFSTVWSFIKQAEVNSLFMRHSLHMKFIHLTKFFIWITIRCRSELTVNQVRSEYFMDWIIKTFEFLLNFLSIMKLIYFCDSIQIIPFLRTCVIPVL